MTRNNLLFERLIVLVIMAGALVMAQDQATQVIRVFAGQGVRMICNASSTNPNTQYQWEKPRGNILSREYTLVIPAVDQSHVGVYSCRAISLVDGKRMEDIKSTTLALRESGDDVLNIGGGAEEPEPEISIQPPVGPGNVAEKAAGSNFYQTCVINNDGTGNYRFHWLGPDGRKLSEQNFFFLSELTDRNNGEYTCVATNVQTNTDYRKAFRLVVVGGSSIGGSVSEYNVFITSNPSTPIVGRSLSLQCETQPSLPGATFQWFSSGKLLSSQAQLRFAQLDKKELNQDYECRVSYNGILRTATQGVTIKFYLEKELSLQPAPGPQIVVRAGDRKELHCDIERQSGYRGADVQWFFNGLPLLVDNRNILRLNRFLTSIITLVDVSAVHEGKYECRLSNILKEAYLIVMEEGASLQVNPNEIRAKEGEFAEFHCRASNIPGVINNNLVWYFLGDDLNGARRPLTQGWLNTNSDTTKETSFIGKERVVVYDQGYYLCEEPNGLTAIARLIVEREQVISINVVVTPIYNRVQVNSAVYFTCDATRDGIPFGNPMWRFADGRVIQSDPRFSVYPVGSGRSELRVTGVALRDNNTIVECYVDAYSAKGYIIVEGNVCGPTTFRCTTGGECFDRSRRCDGTPDCADRSDEDPAYCAICDPLDLRCESYNGISPLKLTFSPSWQCDGEDDCGNGFDETNCQIAGNQCGGTTYQCSDGMTIPRAYLCDKESDCRGGDDESGCSGPPVIVNSQSTPNIQRVPVGRTVRLTCTARGKPLPKVIWRYNWRCLPDKGRMRVDFYNNGCDNVESTLTITDVRPEDEGIYNCEALSANQRSISDDYQVIVLTNP